MNTAIRHLRGNAVAYIALFISLGGTSYAALSLPAGSVGTRQLRDGAVTSNKIANRSITPGKLDPAGIGAATGRMSARTGRYSAAAAPLACRAVGPSFT